MSEQTIAAASAERGRRLHSYLIRLIDGSSFALELDPAAGGELFALLDRCAEDGWLWLPTLPERYLPKRSIVSVELTQRRLD